ncbi:MULTISPECIES: HAMP domain-containing sensor histidine kinase [Clostridia]|uniref:HAMP domain-containing sensor histidine kinase n=1 Tax=Clostridia TaxID=186801 RepID=UPI000EA3B763|nr:MULTISPECIES: HAMP domain-containing sensor histidine kinase [Clostridia]NBJ69199.1 sensor histidine kinase [Roseburia sp. 1XD42-34]RKI79171.1 sensor histidine kinase [Clostridium sp. 1xD42-85]
MINLFRSLQAKYMFIIVMAVCLIFLIQTTYTIFEVLWEAETNEYMQRGNMTNYDEIEERWYKEARKLEASHNQIHDFFEEWKQNYPKASMFWVDGNGYLAEQMNIKEGSLPSQWTPAYTAKFMKSRYDGDPFTVVTLVGESETNGLVVFQVPRSTFQSLLQKIYDQYMIIFFIAMIFIIMAFITISFLFFRRIRDRLLQLQEAMTIRDVDGLPIPIHVKKKDEVGQLEQTFNQMVSELRISKEREREEEQLRRELIANLSHDLRTPLTKIRAQIYSLARECEINKAKQSLRMLEFHIMDVDKLLENLVSYTILMASKYELNLKEVDIVRLVRTYLASWYPVFEKEQFLIEIELATFKKSNWLVDPTWFERILDNLLQNVLRHAKDGLYIGVKTVSKEAYDAFLIIDKGRGFEKKSEHKGAGIGLSIVDLMVKGMGLDWNIKSSEHGTTIKIKRYKQ